MTPQFPDDLSENPLSHIFRSYDAPAYVRRGVRMEQSVAQVYLQCERQREEWFRWLRIRVRPLLGLIGDLGLQEFLAGPDDRLVLERLVSALGLSFPTSDSRPPRRRRLRALLRELVQEIERFNERWRRYVAHVDLSDANRQVAGYNRYYLLEKECALRSPMLARLGYRPAVPLAVDDLLRRFPLLPLPRLRSPSRTVAP